MSGDEGDALVRYVGLRKPQPFFVNTRSIRNALD
jgi:hypothetical protein